MAQTILNDNGKVYMTFRKKYDDDMEELFKERLKIYKSKKNRKFIDKRLRGNTANKLKIICDCIHKTWKVFEKKYYENDYQRNKILTDIMTFGIVPDEIDNLDDEEEKLK